MNIPKISEEAVLKACLEPIDSGRIYDWLMETQPFLGVAADMVADSGDPMLSGHVMVGMALVLRALSYMPPDDAQTLQDRLKRIRDTVDQGGLCRLEGVISKIRQILDE